MCAEPTLIHAFIEAVIAGFSVLGGVVVAWSGALAALAYWPGRVVVGLADAVNEGVALGFSYGIVPAAIATTLVIVIGL